MWVFVGPPPAEVNDYRARVWGNVNLEEVDVCRAIIEPKRKG
jgi:hypothetical protein